MTLSPLIPLFFVDITSSNNLNQTIIIHQVAGIFASTYLTAPLLLSGPVSG